MLKSTSFYRITVIPNKVRNPVISSFAKQDFTGWGKPQPLRLGYIHASMAATLTLRVLLNGSAIFVQAQLRHRCFASCYRLGYKIASYLASLALRHFRLGAYSPFEVVFHLRCQDDDLKITIKTLGKPGVFSFAPSICNGCNKIVQRHS